MPEKKKPRFPCGKMAGHPYGRQSCFTDFFGESVSDALGLVLPAESVNKCQICPDTDICFKISLVKRLDQSAETQKRILFLLESLNERWP